MKQKHPFPLLYSCFLFLHSQEAIIAAITGATHKLISGEETPKMTSSY